MRIMNKITVSFTVLLLALTGKILSQPAAATVPYSCDFENAAERSNWQFANASINNWYIDTAVRANGDYGMYVSCDQGLSPFFLHTDTSNIYAYRRIHFNAGVYSISFMWNFLGSYTNYIVYSYMRVFLLPASATITGGVRYNGLSASRLPQNAISVDYSGAQPVWDNNWNTFTNPMVRIPVTGDYYLVFFFFCTDFSPNSGGYGYSPCIDNVSITPMPCPQPYALTKTDRGNGCISLDWEDAQIPAPTSWTIEYGPRGFQVGAGTNVVVRSKPALICGLQLDSLYDFYVSARCPDGNMSPPSRALRMRYLNAPVLCRDFSDLKSVGTVCTYGQYEEYKDTIGEFYGPYSDTGIINYGYYNYGNPTTMLLGSRHTVHYDPYERDSCSGRQLMTVPPGSNYSVRLGCVYGKWICQSVSYRISVDTSVADMLLLKYACVLYNPDGHDAYRKPRFILELLDARNNLIDQTCGYIDFTATNASGDSSWHIGTDGFTYWKDWTSMGVSLANYNGQTITARLTSFACGQGAKAHFGYAYYNLDCQKAQLGGRYCASTNDPDSALFMASEGFNYRWYSPDNPGFSSNERSIYVKLDGSTYFCDMTVINNPNCGTTLKLVASKSSIAGRLTHAQFDYTKDYQNCAYKAYFNNRSYTSNIDNSDIEYDCDYYYWDFGDSSQVTGTNLQDSIAHEYATFGTYKVMLVVGNSILNCYDTIYKTLVFLPPEKPVIDADTIACMGKYFDVSVQGETMEKYLWNTGDTTRMITLLMHRFPCNLQVHVTDNRGCETDLSIVIQPDSVPVPMMDTLYFASCNPLTVHMHDRNPRAVDNTYTWYWGDGDTSIIHSTSAEHFYEHPGKYDVIGVVSSKNGCRDTVSARALSYDFTKAGIEWEPVIGKVYSPIIKFKNTSVVHEPEYNYYTWKFYSDSVGSVILDSSNLFEPTYRWPVNDNSDVGFYKVGLIAYTPIRTPINEFLCVDSTEIIIYLLNDFLQFPNVVTPNGDGINDIFEIKNLLEGGCYTDNELYIYNHWGRLIYHKKNISTKEEFWDPALNNERTGTYYYRFSAKGHIGNIQRNGVIELIK